MFAKWRTGNDTIKRALTRSKIMDAVSNVKKGTVQKPEIETTPKLANMKNIARMLAEKKPVRNIVIIVRSRLKDTGKDTPRFREEYLPSIVITNEMHFVRKTVKK